MRRDQEPPIADLKKRTNSMPFPHKKTPKTNDESIQIFWFFSPAHMSPKFKFFYAKLSWFESGLSLLKKSKSKWGKVHQYLSTKTDIVSLTKMLNLHGILNSIFFSSSLQLLAAISVSTGCISYGICMAYTSSAIPSMQAPNNSLTIEIGTTETTWMSEKNLTFPLQFCIVFAYSSF